jgi:small subunit ribosomal protein S7
LFGSLKIDYDWFIINWGFDTPQFFNFFFLLKLPTYLVPINFNFLKLKFLKSIKKLFKKKFYFFWKKFNLYFSSNFSMFFLYKNSLFLYKKNIEKLFFFLNIYLNWVSLYSKINIFWNIMLLFLLEKSNIFFKKFIFFTLKLLLDRIAFIKYLLNNSLISSKKKLLLNFISTIVGNKTFYFWIKKKWKKTNFLNLTSLNLNILNVYYLSSNFLKEFFFLTRNLNFSSKFFGFDLVNFISWFYKNFINFLIQKKQFNTSPNNFFFNMCCGIQKKIIFLSISKKKYENFSYFYLKNIQNYKNINMLLNQSFSQQLDVYVNLNLINLLFWFLIWWGKKLTAWRVFINFIKQFKEKYKMPALAIFTHAVLKTEPKIWLKKKKIAGRLYEIPIFISSRRSKSIAIRWLLEYAKKRQKYNISDSLSQEIWDACFNWGSTAHAWTVVHTTAKWNKSYMWWF